MEADAKLAKSKFLKEESFLPNWTTLGNIVSTNLRYKDAILKKVEHILVQAGWERCGFGDAKLVLLQTRGGLHGDL